MKMFMTPSMHPHRGLDKNKKIHAAELIKHASNSFIALKFPTSTGIRHLLTSAPTCKKLATCIGMAKRIGRRFS